jgi:lipoyl(octanoyl) transferase
MPGESILNVARLGVVDYPAALELQRALVTARMHDSIGDTLLLLEHPHVYTLGRGADAAFILDPPADVPIHRVARGGQVTYHGPGQLVAYPIVKLEGAERDVIRYLRKLEQLILDALAAAGITAQRRAGLTGVWVGDEKIASIGVGIRRWTTLHGFAVNVATDLRFFERIVPCGIAGCRMTSLTALGRPAIRVAEFAGLIAPACAAVFDYRAIREVEPGTLWRMLAAPDSDAAAPAIVAR